MNRIMILGQPGSGKSTLARDIGARTGLPVVHVDQIHWMSGWVERDKNEKIVLAHQEEAKDAWVFEGGLSATWDNRLARADTLVVLLFPLWLRAWRVFKRTLINYGRTRADLPDGCPERFSLEFWLWIWRTRETGRAKILRYADMAVSQKPVHILKSPRDVRTFLGKLGPMKEHRLR